MVIYYRDDIGVSAVETDSNEAHFQNGNVYFTDGNGKDYTIAVEHIVMICNSNRYSDIIADLDNIGGCGADADSWADGWDKAITEAIRIVDSYRAE